MANSRTRSSRNSTPHVQNSGSCTPHRASNSSPLPIRSSTMNTTRRSSRLAVIKNSSPQDSEMDSEDADVGDTYLSRRTTQNFKEVRVPTPEVKQPLEKASARSPSMASSASLTLLDQQPNYETPGTSTTGTPADVNAGKSHRATRQRSSFAVDLADDDDDDSVIVVSGSNKDKGKGKMTEREWMEIDDAKIAEKLQAREYNRLDVMGSQGSKRKRAISDTDESSALSDTDDSDDDFSDMPLLKKRTLPKRKKAQKSRSRASKAISVDTDDDADLFQPSGSETVEFETNSPEPSGHNAGPSKNGAGSSGTKSTQQSKDLTGFSAAHRHVIELFSDEEGDPLAHPYWTMNRMERGQYTLSKHHPELKTLWDDLEKIPTITPEHRPQPAGLSRQLKPFQLEGVDWMIKQEQSEWKGGLLGDEMGMGKTIQAVALIMSDYEQTKNKGTPTLVVVPPVALMQWQSEIAMYTDGKLKVLIHHNADSKVKKFTVADLKKKDIILISYAGLESIYRKESKGWRRDDGLVKENSKIHAIQYHRLILDEAHNIKTRTTGVARACFALKAKYKWCLSGTPVQNRIGEFFSLLRFLEVRPFASYFCKICKCNELHWSQDERKMCSSCNHSGFNHVSIFNQELLNPITNAQSNEVRKEALAKLRLITDRIMLRRVKRDHTASMELPPKEVVIHNEFFGDVERDFSSSIMTNSTRQFDTYVSRGVMLNNYANIFGLIMQMRQVANHPDLILKKHGEQGQNVLVCCICDEPAEEPIRSRCRHEFCRKCARDYVRSFEQDARRGGKSVSPDCPRCHIPLTIDFEQPDIEQEADVVAKNSIINRIKMENWTSSTKIEMLVYDLYKLRSKKQTHKSIVFSQFTSMLQLVEWRLRRAGFNTVMLDGTMSPAQRSRSIDYFMNNVDVEVFLVSLKAGGVALNLTEASRVFIVDPWWNPAAEYQSADRCHRIGQRRPCIVKRLVIEDSVESRMVLLQEKKANMIAGTVDHDDVAIEKLTPEDMSFLFRGT